MTQLDRHGGNVVVPLTGQFGFGLPTTPDGDDSSGPRVIAVDGDPAGLPIPEGSVALDYTTPATWQAQNGAGVFEKLLTGPDVIALVTWATALAAGQESGGTDAVLTPGDALRGRDALLPGKGDNVEIRPGAPYGAYSYGGVIMNLGPIAAYGGYVSIANVSGFTTLGGLAWQFGELGGKVGGGATGLRSAALGYRTSASGLNSVALGYNTYATYDNAFAIGSGARADARSGFAHGLSTVGYGADYSAALGWGYAYGSYALATGYNSYANNFASAAFGYYSRANNDCAIAFGTYGRADMPNQVAIGGGTSSGSDQGSVYTYRGRTTDGSTIPLVAEKPTGANQTGIILRTDMSYSVTAHVTGRQVGAAGDSIYVKIEALVQRTGATTALVGATTVTTIAKSAGLGAGVTADIAADDPTDTLRVNVTGEAAKTIEWHATIVSSEAGD